MFIHASLRGNLKKCLKEAKVTLAAVMCHEGQKEIIVDERRFKAYLQKLHCATEIVTFKKEGGHFHPVKLTKANG